jgi:hypothetical protein
MPQPSDSSYIAVTRHRRPYSTAGRPPNVDVFPQSWVTMERREWDEDIPVQRYEALVAPLLEEGEWDAAESAVVSPSGNSSSAAAHCAAERRRREDGWTDLALEALLDPTGMPFPTNTNATNNTTTNTQGSSSQNHHHHQQNNNNHHATPTGRGTATTPGASGSRMDGQTTPS